MRLGERLASARRAERLTLRELEVLAGVSNPLISQIETGWVTNPGVTTVSKLALALRVTPQWLAWGMGPRRARASR